MNSRAFAWTLTARSGVCGVTDQRFHNSREMFEFYATKSCLFLLKAMYVIGNLSDIMDLLILWRLDALFGCGRANSEVDAWSGERWSPAFHYLYSVCHTLSRGFLKLALTGPRRLESQRNVKYTFYLRQVKFFSQFKTIFYRQNMNVHLTY